MPLQNFVDKVGPVISSAWLNMVDVLSTTVFQNASTVGGAKNALGFYTAFKPANTSRASTTTLAIDPDLQISLGAGVYRYEYSMDWTCGVSGVTPGVLFQPAFSGTFASGAGTLFYDNNLGTASISTDYGISVVPVPGAPVGSLRTPDHSNFLVIGHFQVTSAGILSLYWAQANASATPTVLNLTSFVTATQLG